jgi:hypothetical protein
VILIVDTFVPGAAKTKGSLDITKRGYAVENVPGSVTWRCLVAERMRAYLAQTRQDEPASVPVRVQLDCWLPLPRSHEALDDLTRVAATWPRSGDVDKLARNVLDALSCPPKGTAPAELKKYGSVYVDDVLVQSLIVSKYAASDQWPMGVRVRVWRL